LAWIRVLELGRGFLGKLAELLLDLVDEVLGLVLDVDLLGALRSSSAWASASLRARSTLVVGESARALDRDLLLLAALLVLGGHVQDAVGVDVEGHLDLRHPPRRGGDPVEAEVARAACCR
jgi:hypothetical protein